MFKEIVKVGVPIISNQIYIPDGETREDRDGCEAASWKRARPETIITCENIFRSSEGKTEPIRTVVTKGEAGIGKSVFTQRFVLDWAEDKANKDVHLMFLFTFRKLNMLKDREFSLQELLHHCFSELKKHKSTDLRSFRFCSSLTDWMSVNSVWISSTIRS